MNLSNWQPIETAPTGVYVLLSDGQEFALGMKVESPIVYWIPGGISGYEWEWDIVPTHWMSLPELPK